MILVSTVMLSINVGLLIVGGFMNFFYTLIIFMHIYIKNF